MFKNIKNNKPKKVKKDQHDKDSYTRATNESKNRLFKI